MNLQPTATPAGDSGQELERCQPPADSTGCAPPSRAAGQQHRHNARESSNQQQEHSCPARQGSLQRSENGQISSGDSPDSGASPSTKEDSPVKLPAADPEQGFTLLTSARNQQPPSHLPRRSSEMQQLQQTASIALGPTASQHIKHNCHSCAKRAVSTSTLQHKWSIPPQRVGLDPLADARRQYAEEKVRMREKVLAAMQAGS